MSLWEHGDANLDEYSALFREAHYQGVECVDSRGHVRHGGPERCEGHWYGSYPVGVPVLTAPLVLAALGILRIAHPALKYLQPSDPRLAGFLHADYDAGHALIEMEVASFLLAAAAIVIYFIAARFLSRRRSVWLALLFGAATSAYSVAGRGLWAHGPSIVLLSLTILLLLKAEERPALVAWTGLLVALAYTVRPTNALLVIVFTAYVAVRHRAFLGRYLLAAAPVAIVFLGYNFSIYHALFSSYYQTGPKGVLPRNWGTMAMALAANLISPSRGLLIYTPVFSFAIWNMLRRQWKTPLSGWLAWVVLAHWLVISAQTESWWAGHSFGPRFFTDMTPIFVLFLIPFLARWDQLSRTTRIAFLTVALAGAGIHLRGGWSAAVYRWNAQPVNVDASPNRVWDWSDPQFLRLPLIGEPAPA